MCFVYILFCTKQNIKDEIWNKEKKWNSEQKILPCIRKKMLENASFNVFRNDFEPNEDFIAPSDLYFIAEKEIESSLTAIGIN